MMVADSKNSGRSIHAPKGKGDILQHFLGLLFFGIRQGRGGGGGGGGGGG